VTAIRPAILALVSSAALVAAAPATAPLRFSIAEGRLYNEFFRQGPVAAHVVLRSGAKPRLIIAFPAGNSGVALWLDAGESALEWRPVARIEAARRTPPGGGTLRGVTVDLEAAGGPVSIVKAAVGSVRVIREFEHTGALPPELETTPDASSRVVTWQRRRLDGAPGYYLSLELLEGEASGGGSKPIELSPGPNGRLRLSVTGLTGDTPLTPLVPADGAGLLTRSRGVDPQLRRMLEFLCYREKLLAGSWRFNTYFGRDTLMSLRLLAPVLRPQVVEAGLGSVLRRLNGVGEVAHEEDIGEYAVLRRKRAGLAGGDQPLFDYKMIDDDFMLAIVAAHYLLDSGVRTTRATPFLAQAAGPGETNGSALARNARFVVDAAASFAREPDWRRLIALKPGENAGNWRDSEQGLGGGRFPYDVNGILVPAALDAIDRLHASGLLEPYLDPQAQETIRAAAAMAATWRREAPRYFDVRFDAAAARENVAAYAGRIGIDPEPALREIAAAPVIFHAVSLDAAGRPVPILNSDEAFALLFAELAPVEAAQIVETMMRPFPAGLLTGVGLLVANPAFAPATLQPVFDRSRYHGTVVWSWQQAMLRAGIDRQLARGDLTQPVRARLTHARGQLQRAIDAATGMRGSELWSWSWAGGTYAVEPFGQELEHETESNAAQLWSTVHLSWPRERGPGS